MLCTRRDFLLSLNFQRLIALFTKVMLSKTPLLRGFKIFSKLMELLDAGSQAMVNYFWEDDPAAFDRKYFSELPLLNKALGF